MLRSSTSTTSRALLQHWFEDEHLIEQADGSLAPFRYYFAQREAVETIVYLLEIAIRFFTHIKTRSIRRYRQRYREADRKRSFTVAPGAARTSSSTFAVSSSLTASAVMGIVALSDGMFLPPDI